MENTFVVNEEPITIRITIEIIPPKKREEVSVVEKPLVIQAPTYELPNKDKEVAVKAPIQEPPACFCVEHDADTNELDVLACKNCRMNSTCTTKREEKKVVVPEEPEMVFEPIPEKKKRAYNKKQKDVVPVETPVVLPETKTVAPVGVPATTNKVVARTAQMIKFYCKASGISTTDITKKYLIDHGAGDITEGVSDDVIDEAIKEVGGK